MAWPEDAMENLDIEETVASMIGCQRHQAVFHKCQKEMNKKK
jgi:hypothetical protein